ncbi:MAG TPA: CBU_0585 family protein [Gammaproteobacteria bacterium]|nr:CBU_0585 family protein [Gammaproteobacteria bacterium]
MTFWRKKPLFKNYISEIDEFLHAFDEKTEASSGSRKAEESKYQRINQLRDNPDAI